MVALVFSVCWLGVAVGQNLTRHVFNLSALTSSALAGQSIKAKSDSQQDRYESIELFQKVLHFVRQNYVNEVDDKELIQGAIKGMLETLDPHSAFLPPEVLKEMKTDTSGKFGGLGIEIGVKDQVLTIISPIEDTPAWKAGLKPGDRIVRINKESTKGMSLVEAVSKMRGKKGTDVTLSIYRTGFDKIKDVKVTRDIIKIVAVKSEELENGYGYVRLASFNENAASDVKKAIEKLEKKGKLQGLVFDLRMNPGGLLDQAVEVASLFVDNGVIVSTIPRNKDMKEVKYARKGVARKDFPVVILVNSSTASAAEIVAGALQDHHRAIIMGQSTFGKGSVQTVIELGKELGLKLTIARYYTPSGRSIQEKGVQPDIVLDDFDPKLLAEAKRKTESFRERDLKGHMANDTSEKAKDDYQMEELDTLGKVDKDKKSDKSDKKDKEDDEMAPLKFNPKEDYQVREGLNYLKSFELIKKLSVEKTENTSAAAKLDKTVQD